MQGAAACNREQLKQIAGSNQNYNPKSTETAHKTKVCLPHYQPEIAYDQEVITDTLLQKERDSAMNEWRTTADSKLNARCERQHCVRDSS